MASEQISWIWPALEAQTPPPVGEFDGGFGPVYKGDQIELLFSPSSYTGDLTWYCDWQDSEQGDFWNISNPSGSPLLYTFDETTPDPDDLNDVHTCHFYGLSGNPGNTQTFQYFNFAASSPTLWTQSGPSSIEGSSSGGGSGGSSGGGGGGSSGGGGGGGSSSSTSAKPTSTPSSSAPSQVKTSSAAKGAGGGNGGTTAASSPANSPSSSSPSSPSASSSSPLGAASPTSSGGGSGGSSASNSQSSAGSLNTSGASASGTADANQDLATGNSGSISPGKAVGITLGAVAAALLIATAIFCFYRRRRRAAHGNERSTLGTEVGGPAHDQTQMAQPLEPPMRYTGTPKAPVEAGPGNRAAGRSELPGSPANNVTEYYSPRSG